MGNPFRERMAVEGRLARLVYLSLYGMHLLAIHGWLKGTALIVVGHVNKIGLRSPFQGAPAAVGFIKRSAAAITRRHSR